MAEETPAFNASVNTHEAVGLLVVSNDNGEELDFKSLGNLSSDSDSLDDDILRSVDAFSDFDEKEYAKYALSLEDIR